MQFNKRNKYHNIHKYMKLHFNRQIEICCLHYNALIIVLDQESPHIPEVFETHAYWFLNRDI